MENKLFKSHNLYEIISDAYRVFRCPKPITLGVCNCCMNSKIEKDFFRPKVDELPIEYIREWFKGSIADDFSQSVWTYILPRVLEILALGKEPSFIGIEVSLNRFPTGNRSHWKSDQWSVLERFQFEYLKSGSFPDGVMLDDIICMFAEASFPIDSLIKSLETWSDEMLVQRLWADWCEWTISNEIWLTAFWEESNVDKIWAWYTSQSLYDRISSFGLSNEANEDISAKALEVADVIELSMGVAPK